MGLVNVDENVMYDEVDQESLNEETGMENAGDSKGALPRETSASETKLKSVPTRVSVKQQRMQE